MHSFWTLIFACTFVCTSGFNVRRVRQSDAFTNQLELKLLRSTLKNEAAIKNQIISNDQSETVTYSLPQTFIIKQQVPVAAVSIDNIQPISVAVAPSFRADFVDDDDVLFEEETTDNMTTNSVEVIKLPNSTEEENLDEDDAANETDADLTNTDSVNNEAMDNKTSEETDTNDNNSLEDEDSEATTTQESAFLNEEPVHNEDSTEPDDSEEATTETPEIVQLVH
ncbi:hypothetical protein FO519_003171 [Halicephalobus sp. NKZ332]|nr:hypothetical protein FO519_003171 [Halicephalobus sp. NKZ332]